MNVHFFPLQHTGAKVGGGYWVVIGGVVNRYSETVFVVAARSRKFSLTLRVHRLNQDV